MFNRASDISSLTFLLGFSGFDSSLFNVSAAGARDNAYSGSYRTAGCDCALLKDQASLFTCD
jgi:hypothetical protein